MKDGTTVGAKARKVDKGQLGRGLQCMPRKSGLNSMGPTLLTFLKIGFFFKPLKKMPRFLHSHFPHNDSYCYFWEYMQWPKLL